MHPLGVLYFTTTFLRNIPPGKIKPYPTISWQDQLTGGHRGPDPNRERKFGGREVSTDPHQAIKSKQMDQG